MDRHTGGKWSICGTKHRPEYQLQLKKTSLLFMPQGLRPSLWKQPPGLTRCIRLGDLHAIHVQKFFYFFFFDNLKQACIAWRDLSCMYNYVHAQHLHGLLADRWLQKDPACIWKHTKCVISRPGVGRYISFTLWVSVDRWRLIIKEHWYGKCFQFMTSACVFTISPSIPQTTRNRF